MPNLCGCGCGEEVGVWTRNNKRYGWVKGQPKKYVFGHRARQQDGGPRSEETKRRISVARKGKRVGPEHPNWKGGKTVGMRGYIFVRVGVDHPMANHHGYVQEHRLVMSRHLGRLLKSDEVVHHVNRDVQDNRLENLVLFENSGAHVRHHARERAQAKEAQNH